MLNWNNRQGEAAKHRFRNDCKKNVGLDICISCRTMELYFNLLAVQKKQKFPFI